MEKRLFFTDVFYPGDEAALYSLVKCDEAKDVVTPTLFLLPHASLENVSDMYKDAFSHIHHPKKIVLLMPLHSGPVEEDRDISLFTLSSGTIATSVGNADIESVPGLKCADYYAEEEYSAELVYPFVAVNSPSSRILPVFTNLKTKEEVLTLARLMASLKKSENNTVFIISGNFTEEGDSESITRQARTLQGLLEHNAPMLDSIAKRQVTGCAARILEAARTVTGGIFRIKMARCGSYAGPEIPAEADGRIWQVYGVKE